MRRVILDLETDGFLEHATKIHSMVLRDVDTNQVVSCANQPGYVSLSEGLRLVDQAEVIYGHNIITFDRPALKKLLGYDLPWEKCRDTYVIAAMRWTNIKELDFDLVRAGKFPPGDLIGKHNLEAWGYRLGALKGTYGKTKDFSTWSPEMQTYCEQDTLVNRELVLHLRNHAPPPPLAIETEQELRLYLDKQEKNGWPFNIQKAAELQGRLSSRREELSLELQKHFKPWFKSRGEFTPKRDNTKTGYVAGCVSTKVELTQFNPGSRQHISDRLQKVYGWKPTVFTSSGQPEVNEDTLLSLPQDIPGVKMLVEYLLVVKRLGQLAEGDKAWLKLTRKNPITGMEHIHGVCLQSGTVTHRASHFNPNLAQVPAVGAPYGEECRALFCVPEGWVQVGADASGLELRELSHYMAKFDGGAYGRTVTEGKNEDGTDIHSVNRDALGLSGKPGRNKAKTFIYAFLYGSGDLNLGQLMAPSEEEVRLLLSDVDKAKDAKKQLKKRDLPTDDHTTACFILGGQLRARFLKNLPALNSLITGVKEKAKEQKYLLLHDGRRVPIRHQHAALNSLLQGSGSIVCKRWLVRFNRRLTAEFGEQGWHGQWAALGWIHDEVQLAVRPEIAERVRKILVEEIEAVGLEFNMRIPLTGEAKQGAHWADCH